jgi:hypothetical protein
MIAIDQYGDYMYIEGKHPRKELTEKLGVKHCEKMYADRNGKTYHVGYIISGRWFNLYTKWEKPA